MQDPAYAETGPPDMMAEPDGMMPMADVIPPEVLQLRRQMVLLTRLASMSNVAEAIEPEKLSEIGARVVREYKLDRDSRAEWEKTAKRALDIARQKKEPKSHPWPNASNVKYPVLTTASLQFAARAYPAIVDGPRIVKCAVVGRDPGGLKAARADRVSQHMSYQLLHELEEWESDMDVCLHQIPVVGCAFKKVYIDPSSKSGFRSELISALDFVVNQATKSLESVPRATHVFTRYPHEIDERIREGTFLEFDHKGGGEDGDDDDAPHEFLEQHRYWDIDGDGVAEPWIVTVHHKLQKVVRIMPGFDPNAILADPMRGKIVRIPKEQYFVKIPFIPDPEGGFYDIGFGRLLEPMSDIIDTTINQMMDAGTLQNAGGGFIGSGLNLGKAKVSLVPGEFRTVQSAGDDIRKAIVHMEHRGPSPVLANLLTLMIESAKDVASVKDILTGETPSNQTATSTMAAIEQGLKVFTAIYKRIFRALRQEYKLIFKVNQRQLNQPKYFQLLDEPQEVVASDYADDLDVMPTADPNSVTDMQRIAKAQFLMEQVAAGNPFIDGLEATRRALEGARIERIEDILKPPEPDPMQQDGMRAEIDAKKAETIKKVADARVSLAQIGAPLGAPMQIAEPAFMPPPPPGPPPGAGGPGATGEDMDADEMMGGMPPGMGGMPPPDMQGGMPSDLTPQELEAMAMQLGGAPLPSPEAAPVPPGMPV